MTLPATPRWIVRRQGQLASLMRLGPTTLSAYLRIARVVAAERLWQVPPRARAAAAARADRAPAREARP